MSFLKSMMITGFVMIFFSAMAQEEDLLSLLDEEETVNYTTASFKANRVVNLHSLENTAAGELDIKISHRFGAIDGGFNELFGLDGPATIRIGGDYGITERLMIGIGRSNYEKTYDGFIKFKILRQSTGAKVTPITLCVLGTTAIRTTKFNPDQVNFFSSRLFYTGQLILGRKFSNAFSLQLSPTVVHRNLVTTNTERNDVLALGAAARIKLGKRTSLNGEYIYVHPDQLGPQYKNSISVGFDIETGGHVFQLHFTNSISMIEKGFVAETGGESPDRNVYFGFNLSRVFNIK